MLGPLRVRDLDQPLLVPLEALIPEDELYRQLDKALDLSFVREWAKVRYADGGRPSVDPVVFSKLQLVRYLGGLRSERQLMRLAADRLSLLWYVGYGVDHAGGILVGIFGHHARGNLGLERIPLPRGGTARQPSGSGRKGFASSLPPWTWQADDHDVPDGVIGVPQRHIRHRQMLGLTVRTMGAAGPIGAAMVQSASAGASGCPSAHRASTEHPPTR